MKFQEISERCWTGYRQAGMKKKGDRMVPNCVPVAEVKIGPEMSANELLYAAAARAMRDASREGITLDYEQAIKQASKIYGIPYTPSELPKLLAQRAEIDRQLALLKQGKQVAKQRRKEKLAPTPAGAEEYWKTHALPTDRIKPATRTLEAVDPFLDNTARELLGLVIIAGGAFAASAYYSIVNKLKKYQGRQIIDALERKGVKFNREIHERVQPLLDQFKQALRDNEGAQAKELAKRIEQTIIMGKLSAPEPRSPDTALAAKEKELAEDLKKWFKEKWVRFGPDGKIRGSCARGSESEGKPKCLPQSKAHALGKKGRASAAAKKRREDPNPERRGPAKNVATKVKEDISTDTKSLLQNIIGLEYLAKNKEFDSTMFGIKIGTSYFVPKVYKAIENFENRYGEQGKNLINQVRQVVYSRLNNLSKDRNYQNSEFDKIVLFLFNNHKDIIDNFQQLSQKQISNKETNINENDWNDADEFGMPDSEFFPDDDRLRDGDYVRDSQDDEYGEVFRMVGDPSERRVRILDRDGKGWYISPDRLVAVDRDDPAIQKYFGKRRHRDMDEANVKKPQPYHDKDWIKKLTPQERSKIAGPNYKKINQQRKEKQKVDEKQDACYRKVKSRYKVWPSAYASGALVQCRKKGAANWGNKKK